MLCQLRSPSLGAGKEKLQGTPDYAKGSYYANPQYDRPVEDPEIIAKYSSFVHPNIWPTEDLPELADAFKELGQLMVHTGLLVARQCDKFVHKNYPTYPEDKLHHIIETSKCCKARLLHYFSRTAEEIAADNSTDLEYSNWCGWHNDHGSLTGLVSAIYTDDNGNQVPCPDPTAGLYVRNRRSELVKVNIPPDHLAFQIGETAQVHSGGLLQATPHAVRGANVPGVSRQTYAVFMEPMWDYPMDVPEGVDPAAAQTATAAENLPRGVPRLGTRWEAGIDFGEFTSRTHQSYY